MERNVFLVLQSVQMFEKKWFALNNPERLIYHKQINQIKVLYSHNTTARVRLQIYTYMRKHH